MTENRPSLQRKDTRKTKEARQAELDAGVRITHDDKTYEVRLGDVSPQIARRFRLEYGSSFMRLINELGRDPDIDTVAGIVWMARLLGGEDLEFKDVEVTYADMEDYDVERVDSPSPTPEHISPEA